MRYCVARDLFRRDTDEVKSGRIHGHRFHFVRPLMMLLNTPIICDPGAFLCSVLQSRLCRISWAALPFCHSAVPFLQLFHFPHAEFRKAAACHLVVTYSFSGSTTPSRSEGMRAERGSFWESFKSCAALPVFFMQTPTDRSAQSC